VVTSRDEGHVVAWNHLSDGDVAVFEEGEFPMDAAVAVYVATVWNRWMRVSQQTQHYTVTPPLTATALCQSVSCIVPLYCASDYVVHC